MMKKFGAFTLAEVLIALGIIGVVAAATMPTLIANYQKHMTVNQLKKITSVFKQAIELSKIENGDIQNWNFSDGTTGETDIFLKKYIFPYLKTVKTCEHDNNSACFVENIYTLDGNSVQNIIDENWSTFILADGTAIAALVNNGTLALRVDINGIKSPNRSGRDIFCYGIDNNQFMPCFYATKVRGPFVRANGYCASDKTSHGFGCAQLIHLDGWKIAPDYPW